MRLEPARVAIALAPLAALPMLFASCDECAGTPSCHGYPTVSISGQFVEHRLDRVVPGVSVAFVRTGGIDLIADTLRGVTDGDGFFNVRGGSIYNGRVQGKLLVTPPAPLRPFTVPDVTIATSTIRGDGDNLGRLVVNPYLLLVGHVRDRKTLAPLVGATVRMRRVGGGVLESDTRTFTTDFGGQFSWEPSVLQPDTVHVVFEIDAGGYPRTYVVPRDLPLEYREGEMAFTILPVGWGLAYSGGTGRRGSGELLAGTTVTFRRTGGIATQPARKTLAVDGVGRFPVDVTPLEEGTLYGDLIVTPPEPLRAETTAVVMKTSDDDRVRSIGFFGYGAQVALTADLRDARTGERLPRGTRVVMKRVGGVALAGSSAQSSGDRFLSDTGLVFSAATADSGRVQFDMIVHLSSPFLPDTIFALSIPSAYSDSVTALGVVRVRRRTP